MKTFLLLFFLMSLNLQASAQSIEPAAPSPSDSPFYLEIAVVNDFPIQGWQGYTYGAGGQAALGYMLDDDLSIQMNVNDLYFPNGVTRMTDNEIRIYPELKFYFSTLDDLRPYLLAGTGLDFESLTGPSATSWIGQFGLGIDWDLKSDLALFVEGKWTGLTTNNLNNYLPVVAQDIPLVWGFRFGL